MPCTPVPAASAPPPRAQCLCLSGRGPARGCPPGPPSRPSVPVAAAELSPLALCPLSGVEDSGSKATHPEAVTQRVAGLQA